MYSFHNLPIYLYFDCKGLHDLTIPSPTSCHRGLQKKNDLNAYKVPEYILWGMDDVQVYS